MRAIIKSTIRKQVTTISGFESGRDRATSSLRKAHGSFNKSLLHDPTPISIFFIQRNLLFAPMFANNEPTLSADRQTATSDYQTWYARRKTERNSKLGDLDHTMSLIPYNETGFFTVRGADPGSIDPTADPVNSTADPADSTNLATSRVINDNSIITDMDDLNSPAIFNDSAADANFTMSSAPNADSEVLRSEILDIKTQIQVLIDMSINSGSGRTRRPRPYYVTDPLQRGRILHCPWCRSWLN